MRNTCLFAVLAVFLAAGSATAELGTGPQSLDSVQGMRPEVVRVPLSQEASDAIAVDTKFTPGGDPLPIYLNRWGGTYYGGYDNSATDSSSIVPGTSATIGEFNGSDFQWSTVLGCVQDQFAAFNVYVTDIEPLDGEYVEAVVGGSPGQLGMSNGVGGVAPYDPQGCNIIPRAVVYAFADVYGTSAYGLQSLCETITQEVAHAFTLDHEMLCEDPMTYLSDCGAKSFQDVYAPCGEYEERQCTCSGDTQNSVQELFTRLGPNEGVEIPPPPDDNEVPHVEILSPVGESVALQDSTIEITAIASDDVGLVSVQLLWETTGEAMHCPGSGNAWSCTQSGDQYVWLVSVSRGLRVFSVKARDVVGKSMVTESRRIWLGESLDEEIPEDTIPPEALIVAPYDGQILPEDTRIEVTATAYDAETDVLWSYLVVESGWGVRSFPCPFESTNSSCEVVADGTYHWSIRGRWGERAIAVVAFDLMGNIGQSAVHNVTLSDPAPPATEDDMFEPNDSWGQAQPAICGEVLDLRIAPDDHDWVEILGAHRTDGPNQKVTVHLDGPVSSQVLMRAHFGPTSAQAVQEAVDGQVSLPAPPGRLMISVMPEGIVVGTYTMTIDCEDIIVAEPEPDTVLDDDDDPAVDGFAIPFVGGCHHEGESGATGAWAVALLGLIAFVVGRRRSSTPR